MSKAVLFLGVLLLAGCSRTDQDQTRDDARKLGQDLKRDTKKADEVVTQELKDARVKVQEDTHKLKNDLNKPKDNR